MPPPKYFHHNVVNAQSGYFTGYEHGDYAAPALGTFYDYHQKIHESNRENVKRATRRHNQFTKDEIGWQVLRGPSRLPHRRKVPPHAPPVGMHINVATPTMLAHPLTVAMSPPTREDDAAAVGEAAPHHHHTHAATGAAHHHHLPHQHLQRAPSPQPRFSSPQQHLTGPPMRSPRGTQQAYPGTHRLRSPRSGGGGGGGYSSPRSPRSPQSPRSPYSTPWQAVMQQQQPQV